MALERVLKVNGVALNPVDERRIHHHLDVLEQRLANHAEPTAVLVLTQHRDQRQIEVDLRVQVSPLASHLISHQRAETADRAVRLAIEDVERQLERRHAAQRGEPTFGVPSRRLPAHLRPAPFVPGSEQQEAGGETEEK